MGKSTQKKLNSAMDRVSEVWKRKKADGWSMKKLGEAMGYPSDSAKQSVAQFLRSKKPQLNMLERFAEAVEIPLNSLLIPRASAMSKSGNSDGPATLDKPRVLPFDPIDAAMRTPEHARRSIVGILDSYNGSYDAIAEAVQNSMDALEDAFFQDMPGPYLLEVTVDLANNAISVFDTGVGMTQDQVCEVCAPSASFKDELTAAVLLKKRGRVHSYRGHKGVGLTFLAYGTDDIQIHTRQGDVVVKGRMKQGRKWALGKIDTAPKLQADESASPIDKCKRGTWVRVAFSPDTKPANLSTLGSTIEVWETILRTRTAAGQVLIRRESVMPIKIKLILKPKAGLEKNVDVKPAFYYPSNVVRNPPFRFLDVWDYHIKHPGITDHEPSNKRQDGLYLDWTTDEIRKNLGADKLEIFSKEIADYGPSLYAFRPYQAQVWSEINESATGQNRSHYFSPGLVVAVNRQRMADVFAIKATRSDLLAANVFVLVHFDGAKPDQGRKTLQIQLMDLAQIIADTATQYLLKQTSLLKPAGEKTTAAQREVERNHEDWVFNVRNHSRDNPLSIPPVTLTSEPITEQDVVGLFHQLSAIGLFTGMKIYATSAAHTYDCYVQYEVKSKVDALRFDENKNILGLSTDVLGKGDTKFITKGLTLEFKNNLEGLIEELDDDNKRKTFSHIDVCVCWSGDAKKYRSYSFNKIDNSNLHEREFPGVTHVLRKDGESHVMMIILLSDIVGLISAGTIDLKRLP